MPYTINNTQFWPQTIPDASLQNDGIMTKAMVAELDAVAPPTPGSRGAAFDVTSETLNIYIDAATGNDNNDGLTPATALATIHGMFANNKIPLFPIAPSFVVVTLLGNGLTPEVYVAGPGDSFASSAIYFGGGASFFPTLAFQGPEMVPAVLATGPTTAALDVVPAVEVNLNNASGVATPLRTRLDFTAAAPGWTADDMAGRYFVRIKRAGTQLYFELPISGNTTNQIFIDTTSATPAGTEFGPNGAIVGSLMATDTVEIVQPGAVISDSVGGFGSISFIGSNSPNAYIGGLFGGGLPHFSRIGFQTSNLGSAFQVNLDRCTWTGEFTAFGAFAMANCASRGGHVNLAGAGYPGPTFSIGAVTDPGPSVALAGYQMQGITVGFGGPPFPNAFGPFSATGMCYALPIGLWSSRPLPGQGAVQISGPGSALILKASLVGSIDTVASPNLPAIRARLGSQVAVNSTLLAITGDPAVGDLQVDTGAVIKYGTGAGNFKEALGWNGNFTRVLEGTATHPTGDMSRITDYPVA